MRGDEEGFEEVFPVPLWEPTRLEGPVLGAYLPEGCYRLVPSVSYALKDRRMDFFVWGTPGGLRQA